MSVAAFEQTPVEIFQDPVEFASLLDLYRERRPRTVLEIGTFKGGTLFHWLSEATEGATVVAVDDRHVNAELYEGWRPAGVELRVIRGRSESGEVATELERYAPYEFVFIDADHRYPSVLADWLLCEPLAAQGALVCFHDIAGKRRASPEIQVRRLWAEIKAAGYETQEFVEKPRWWGIGVVEIP